MKRHVVWALAVSACAVFGGFSLASRTAHADDNAVIRALERRIEKLEAGVQKAAKHDTDFEKRLDELERALREVTRGIGGTPSQLSPRANTDQLRDAVRDLRSEIGDVTRRLDRAAMSGGSVRELKDDLRRIERLTVRLKRDVDELERRVVRVESRL
jgi:septal ring factor EnvC (AmiA/AmiB activator)